MTSPVRACLGRLSNPDAPSLRPPERGQSMVLCYLHELLDLAGFPQWHANYGWSMPAGFIMC